MLPRFAGLIAGLIVLCVAPAVASANPSVTVQVLTSTNLSKLPATVTHRLTLSAGARDEVVRVRAAGDALRVGGSAVITEPTTAAGPTVSACDGRWDARHDAFGKVSNFTVGFRIPAGTSATVDLPISLTAAPFADESIDGIFDVEPLDGSGYVVDSPAPAYSGPIAADMSLVVIRARHNSVVVSGQAGGKSGGRVEIFGYAPGHKRATRLKTVHADADGLWSWAGWRPHGAGRWELYALYRRSAKSTITGASQCGTLVPVRATAH